MKSLGARILASLILLVLAWMVLVGAKAATKKGPLTQPNKLVILSTTDVKGKTSPCG